MDDSYLVGVGLSALAGGMVSAAMGWLGSNEPFNKRKFGKSMLVSLVAAVTFAVGFEMIGEVTLKDYLLVFLSAAGGDALLNRFGKL